MTIHTYNSGLFVEGPVRSEFCEQVDSMGWIQKNHPDRWPLVWHTANEVKASAKHMQDREKAGVKAGVPDIVDAGGPINGFFELKRLHHRPAPGKPIRRSYPTKAQREFLAEAAARGHFAAICYGFDQFKKAYADYLKFIACG